jgi:hypothetical protein
VLPKEVLVARELGRSGKPLLLLLLALSLVPFAGFLMLAFSKVPAGANKLADAPAVVVGGACRSCWAWARSSCVSCSAWE